MHGGELVISDQAALQLFLVHSCRSDRGQVVGPNQVIALFRPQPGTLGNSPPRFHLPTSCSFFGGSLSRDLVGPSAPLIGGSLLSSAHSHLALALARSKHISQKAQYQTDPSKRKNCKVESVDPLATLTN